MNFCVSLALLGLLVMIPACGGSGSNDQTPTDTTPAHSIPPITTERVSGAMPPDPQLEWEEEDCK